MIVNIQSSCPYRLSLLEAFGHFRNFFVYKPLRNVSPSFNNQVYWIFAEINGGEDCSFRRCGVLVL